MPYTRYYWRTERALVAWIGRLLAKPIALENCSICALDAVAGFFITNQRTLRCTAAS